MTPRSTKNDTEFGDKKARPTPLMERVSTMECQIQNLTQRLFQMERILIREGLMDANLDEEDD
jgi:hypothetical protein